MSQSPEARARPRRRGRLLVGAHVGGVLCEVLTLCRIQKVQQEEVGGQTSDLGRGVKRLYKMHRLACGYGYQAYASHYTWPAPLYNLLLAVFGCCAWFHSLSNSSSHAVRTPWCSGRTGVFTL